MPRWMPPRQDRLRCDRDFCRLRGIHHDANADPHSRHDQRATVLGICRISSRYAESACSRRGDPAHRRRTLGRSALGADRSGRFGRCGGRRGPALLRRDRRARRSRFSGCFRSSVLYRRPFDLGSKCWGFYSRMGLPTRRSPPRGQSAQVRGERGLFAHRPPLLFSRTFRFVKQGEAANLIAFT